MSVCAYVGACMCIRVNVSVHLCAPMCIWVQVVDLSGLWKAFSALKMFTTLLERGNKHLGSWREIWSAQVCGSGQEASRHPESGEMRVVWSSQKMLTAGGPGRTARAPEREGGRGVRDRQSSKNGQWGEMRSAQGEEWQVENRQAGSALAGAGLGDRPGQPTGRSSRAESSTNSANVCELLIMSASSGNECLWLSLRICLSYTRAVKSHLFSKQVSSFIVFLDPIAFLNSPLGFMCLHSLNRYQRNSPRNHHFCSQAGTCRPWCKRSQLFHQKQMSVLSCFASMNHNLASCFLLC